MQVSSYNDQQGNKRYSTDVIVEDFEFCESKAEREASSGMGGFNSAPSTQTSSPAPSTAGFSIDSDAEDEDLPF